MCKVTYLPQKCASMYLMPYIVALLQILISNAKSNVSEMRSIEAMLKNGNASNTIGLYYISSNTAVYVISYPWDIFSILVLFCDCSD